MALSSRPPVATSSRPHVCELVTPPGKHAGADCRLSLGEPRHLPCSRLRKATTQGEDTSTGADRSAFGQRYCRALASIFRPGNSSSRRGVSSKLTELLCPEWTRPHVDARTRGGEGLTDALG